MVFSQKRGFTNCLERMLITTYKDRKLSHRKTGVKLRPQAGNKGWKGPVWRINLNLF
jgi:hypothetical protein